jgi:hypothetical protein
MNTREKDGDRSARDVQKDNAALFKKALKSSVKLAM